MFLADLTSPRFAALSRDVPVVFPIAAVEQHGPHLPVSTDSDLLGEIVRRVEPRLGDRVVFAPLMWAGNSDHHLDFAGTLSVPPRTYLDLLAGLAGNVLHHGFRRIVFLNGHGGNDVPGRQAAFELRQRFRQRDDLLLLFATYWNLAEAASDPGLAQREMGHACEWETSMMLRIDARRVGDFAALPPVEQAAPFQPGFRAWTTRERSPAGYIGRPDAASAEKGERLLQRFSDGAVDFLERVVRWDGSSWAE